MDRKAAWDLHDRLTVIANHEGGEMFMGRPDRWYDDVHWRCSNNHVSTYYLKSEGLGASVCLECYEPIVLTFPEDRDGPLVEPHMAPQAKHKAGVLSSGKLPEGA